MSVWHYEKSPVIKIDADQTGIIDVGTIVTMRDRSYVRGYLAIFPEEQELMAHNATYELLSSTNKLNLGELARLAHKKIVLEVQNYGILQDYFDYVIKPVKNINFQAIHGPKKS
mgnify:CR=1 FL=1